VRLSDAQVQSGSSLKAVLLEGPARLSVPWEDSATWSGFASAALKVPVAAEETMDDDARAGRTRRTAAAAQGSKGGAAAAAAIAAAGPPQPASRGRGKTPKRKADAPKPALVNLASSESDEPPPPRRQARGGAGAPSAGEEAAALKRKVEEAERSAKVSKRETEVAQAEKATLQAQMAEMRAQLIALSAKAAEGTAQAAQAAAAGTVHPQAAQQQFALPPPQAFAPPQHAYVPPTQAHGMLQAWPQYAHPPQQSPTSIFSTLAQTATHLATVHALGASLPQPSAAWGMPPQTYAFTPQGGAMQYLGAPPAAVGFVFPGGIAPAGPHGQQPPLPPS